MKNIFKLFSFFTMAVLLWSCEKDENKITFEGGTAPVVSSSKTGTIPLAFATKDEEAFRLDWSNPNYKFTTGVSSQNVSYTIEIDTTGANFTNPKKKTIAISSNLSKTFTQGELNDYLLNTLELKAGMSHQVEMRVIASLASGAGQLPSNVLKFTMTPYAIPPKVAVPFTGHLYLIGSATPGGDATGWNNPVPVPSQEFTQVSPTLYEITIPLIGGKEYLMIPDNGSWSNKYAVANKSLAGLADGGEFGYNLGDNFPGPAASGTYKITVNFQTGRFSVVKQ
jgi:starch-binding outer membrane protein SusE/F